MAMNLATEFEAVALDQFRITSVTEGLFQAKYSWANAHTIEVFSNDTASLNDYSRTGTARFGSPSEASNTVQSMAVAQEKAFTKIFDALNVMDTGGAYNAGAFLKQQINRIVVPSVDAYRCLALWTACPTGQISAALAITVASGNAYTAFLTGNATLDEAYVPDAGRVCLATPAYLNVLKLDANYVKATELAQSEIIFNGQVGKIDNVPVVKVPDATMNATDNHIDFVIVHVDSVASPLKLATYRVTSNPPGINGDLVEGLIVHDCFLLDALNDGIYIHKHA